MSGTGGAILATDEISLVHWQLTKMAWGALGTANLVSTTDPIPVDLRSDNLSGNLDVAVASIAAGDNNIGNVDVLTLPALPAGTNNIGDVDVLSIIPGVGATNLGKAIDAVAGATDTGVGALAIRRDADTTLAGTTGDWAPLLVDANGYLKVEIFDGGGSHTVDGTVTANLAAGTNNIGDVDVLTVPAPLSTTGGGTEATALRVTLANDSTGVVSVDDNGGSLTVDGTIAISSLPASTNTLEVVGDAAHDAAAAGNPVLQGAYASAAAPTDVSGDADAVRLWALRNGSQVVNLAAGGTLITGDGANGLDVDVTRVTGTVTIAGAVTNTVLSVVGGGTEAAAQRVTLANDSTGVLSVDDNGASLTVDNATLAVVGGGTEATALRVTLANDSTGVLSVDDNGGSLTVDGTVTANAGTGTFITGGDVAHDAADSGLPQKMGAQARQTWQAAVADGDRANLVSDDLGRLITVPHGPRDLVVQNRIILTTTSETTLLAAVTDTFLDLTDLTISNESSTEIRVDIRDATGGSVVWSCDFAADAGGINKMWHVPFKQTTPSNNWTATLSGAASSVYITVQAIKNI